MPRFIVTHRRAGEQNTSATEETFNRTLTAVKKKGNVRVVRTSGRTGRKMTIVEATRAAPLERLNRKGAIVEPLVSRDHHPIIPVRPKLAKPPVVAAAKKAAVPSAPTPLDVIVKGRGKVIAGVSVTLVLTPPAVLNQETGKNGVCSFRYDSSAQAPGSVSTGPIKSFWTVADTTPTSPTKLVLPPIELDGPLAWWQRAVGIKAYEKDRGAGIRVGVIDTGVGPNRCLSHVTVLGSLINGRFDPKGGADVDYHGTAVAGLIAARPRQRRQMAGVAPGVELFGIRVFPANGGSNQADVAAAIDRLVDENQVDLINLSLTGTEPSELEKDAIAYAYEHGTLCICAAGNNAGPISYPASYPEAVSVSALGKKGWGPPSSIAAQMVAASPDQSGRDNFFLAPFSNRGSGLTCSAPGLGLFSTFPSARPSESAWGEDSGTSLSTPLVVGTLAVILAGSSQYLKTPRDRTRADLAREMLNNACRTIGLAAEYQGSGIPTVPSGRRSRIQHRKP